MVLGLAWMLGGDRDGEERAGLRTHFPAVTHCDVGRRRHAPRGGVSAWGGVSPPPCGVGVAWGRGASQPAPPLWCRLVRGSHCPAQACLPLCYLGTTVSQARDTL